jgi:hypothetical protein
MPKRAYFLENKSHHGIKDEKNRFTAILVTSATGEKMKPMIIGKFAKPHSFKCKSFHDLFYYSSSPKSWVNSIIFKDYMIILNEKLKNEKRNIAIILDNCTSHFIDKIKISNISLFYLPSNTTPISQQLDAGFFLFIFMKTLLRGYRMV